MPIYSFRTEGSSDAAGAERMIKQLNLGLIKHWREVAAPGYSLDYYTVESYDGLEVLRGKMNALVDSDTELYLAGEDYRLLPYVDLHRCAQTLERGDRPKKPYADPAPEWP